MKLSEMMIIPIAFEGSTSEIYTSISAIAIPKANKRTQILCSIPKFRSKGLLSHLSSKSLKERQ